MDGSGGRGEWPKRSEIERWKAVPGGVDSDGNVVTKPDNLARAEFILGACERFGCLPSELMKEDAELLKLLRLEDLGRTEEVT